MTSEQLDRGIALAIAALDADSTTIIGHGLSRDAVYLARSGMIESRSIETPMRRLAPLEGTRATVTITYDSTLMAPRLAAQSVLEATTLDQGLFALENPSALNSPIALESRIVEIRTQEEAAYYRSRGWYVSRMLAHTIDYKITLTPSSFGAFPGTTYRYLAPREVVAPARTILAALSRYERRLELERKELRAEPVDSPWAFADSVLVRAARSGQHILPR